MINSIEEHLAAQEFKIAEGEVKLIDRDDATIFYGLFPVDDATGQVVPSPEIIWSIEVFADLEAGR